MGDMVEKVARAIKPEWWGELDGVHPLDSYPQQHKNYQEMAMKEARAALEACHFEELVLMLNECVLAIANCDAPPEAFGVGGEGETHWYMRDELLSNVRALLDKVRDEGHA